MAEIDQGWHKRKGDLPEPGERVIICISGGFVGEGYMKHHKGELRWFRYCDFEPVEDFMQGKVEAWKKMPEPPKRERRKRDLDMDSGSADMDGD